MPSANQKRCNTLERIDKEALQEKAEFMSVMDDMFSEYGVPGAGGLCKLDDAIDERDPNLAMIDQLTVFALQKTAAKQKRGAQTSPSGGELAWLTSLPSLR